MRTRLISIESQPKKVVVVIVVVVFAVVFVAVGLVVGGGVVVAVIIFGHKNLTLKPVQNWVNDKWYIVIVFVIVLV